MVQTLSSLLSRRSHYNAAQLAGSDRVVSLHVLGSVVAIYHSGTSPYHLGNQDRTFASTSWFTSWEMREETFC